MKLLPPKPRGLFNRYRKGMPLIEVFLKDVNYLWLWFVNFLKNGFKNKTILVYPHYPSRGSTIYKTGKILHYNITNKPNKNFDFAVYWEYLTFRKEYHLLEDISKEKRVINLYNRDISKQYVDQVHHNVFGYSTIIDPLKYNGKIVQKNNINAYHDGKILQAPIKESKQGYIYQILIDNSYSNGLVVDIRVPVVGEILDFVYLKFRNISERFKNTTVKTTIEKAHIIFTPEEKELLNNFCKNLKLEYGELDVLRNKTDNKIYVVDVNNTPQGPPANTSKQNASFALKKIADALEKYSKI